MNLKVTWSQIKYLKEHNESFVPSYVVLEDCYIVGGVLGIFSFHAVIGRNQQPTKEQSDFEAYYEIEES